MKNELRHIMRLIISIVAIGFCLLPFNASSEDFSWNMFMPAIIAADAKPQITCESIAGCYGGTFNDNCSGTSSNGGINVNINPDCSFSSSSSYGTEASGSLTDLNGSTYSGYGQTDSNGCGSFNISCTYSYPSVLCNYRYSSGATGSIPNASLGSCKSLNRMKTEMLAGYWVFSYTIGSSTFTDGFFLDIDTVYESSLSSGEFIIVGENDYGERVLARYMPDVEIIGPYSLYDPGDSFKQYYYFSFVSNDSVKGYYYFRDVDTGYRSDRYVLSGSRLSPNRLYSSLSEKSALTLKVEPKNIFLRKIIEDEQTIMSKEQKEIDNVLLRDLDILEKIYE